MKGPTYMSYIWGCIPAVLFHELEGLGLNPHNAGIMLQALLPHSPLSSSLCLSLLSLSCSNCAESHYQEE